MGEFRRVRHSRDGDVALLSTVWTKGGVWLGLGFAARFPFDLGSVVVRFGHGLFALLAALADSPPGAAGHEQGRGRLSAVDFVVGRQESDVRQGDAAGVSVVKLHSDEIVIFINV